MYIHLPEPKQKCSKCGAIDHIEHVRLARTHGGVREFIRCTVCGHEKTISETTIYPETSHQVIYKLKERPEIEEF